MSKVDYNLSGREVVVQHFLHFIWFLKRFCKTFVCWSSNLQTLFNYPVTGSYAFQRSIDTNFMAKAFQNCMCLPSCRAHGGDENGSVYLQALATYLQQEYMDRPLNKILQMVRQYMVRKDQVRYSR